MGFLNHQQYGFWKKHPTFPRFTRKDGKAFAAARRLAKLMPLDHGLLATSCNMATFFQVKKGYHWQKMNIVFSNEVDAGIPRVDFDDFEESDWSQLSSSAKNGGPGGTYRSPLSTSGLLKPIIGPSGASLENGTLQGPHARQGEATAST